MKKDFNTTGTCIPHKHYMADTSNKIAKIRELVDKGYYFTINRPRQYGKTTTMFLLKKMLQEDYFVINTSFEGIDSTSYENAASFMDAFLLTIKEYFEFQENEKIVSLIENYGKVLDFKNLSRFITKFVNSFDKKMVLIIDEVDKSLNNQLFLDFLAMLRNKYLKQNEGEDRSFYSVILGGVHDIKHMKARIRADQARTYNSPWNIAVDFDIDLSLFPQEIGTMLEDFSKSEGVKIDIKQMSEDLFYYTSGYPFLVSKLCEIMYKLKKPLWNNELLIEAVKKILTIDNTNFQSLIKNLEEDEDLYRLVYDILIEGNEKTFNLQNPLINKGVMFGIFKNNNGKLSIHNYIYSEIIYNYMSSKIETSSNLSHNFKDNFIQKDKSLNFKKVLQKFQQFMKEQYSERDREFLERNGRLLFLAFIKPIINGQGFDFKEVQISEEKRLDVVVTYIDKKYIIELKMWYGEKAHQRGLKQLEDYLERQNLSKGYLIIYDKKNKKEWKQEEIQLNGKTIFMVWV